MPLFSHVKPERTGISDDEISNGAVGQANLRQVECRKLLQPRILPVEQSMRRLWNGKSRIAIPRGGVICDPAEETWFIGRNMNMLTGYRYEHFRHVI